MKKELLAIAAILVLASCASTDHKEYSQNDPKAVDVDDTWLDDDDDGGGW